MNVKSISPILALTLAFACGTIAASQTAQTDVTITKTKSRVVDIPASTKILVMLDRTLSSQTDKTDDTFTFTAAENVVIKGMLVVAKGAPGQGHIVSATRAGLFGKAGAIQPAFDWITAVDGEKIHITGTQAAAGGQMDTAGAVAGASAANAITGGLANSVIPFAGLGQMAMGGKKAEVGADKPYAIFVSESVDISSSQAARLNDGFAHAHADADVAPNAPSGPAAHNANVVGKAASAQGAGPIAITSVAVLPQGSLLTLVCVNFTNNGSSNVNAVRYQLQTFNAFHEKNGDTTVNLSGDYAPGTTTHVPRNQTELAPYMTSIALHSPCAQIMPDSAVVSASATPIKAGFADGTVWQGKGTTVSGGVAK